MPVLTTLEAERLAAARRVLAKALLQAPAKHRDEARLQILEAVASKLGSFSLAWYRDRCGIESLREIDPLRTAPDLLSAIEASQIYPALALASLAQTPLEHLERRSTGAFHTDFRLATYAAHQVDSRLLSAQPVLDPACGSGMLLVAATMRLTGLDRMKVARVLTHQMCGADLSRNALRGALLSLSSMTDSQVAIQAVGGRLRQADSLISNELVWADLPARVGWVITNPPWEKLKVMAHEFLRQRNATTHYGAERHGFSSELKTEKQRVLNYAESLEKLYPGATRGEKDLYLLFIAHSLSQLNERSGQLVAILPGGIIRSEGAEMLRKRLLHRFARMRLTVFDNRERFFGVDSRLKFVVVSGSGIPKVDARLRLGRPVHSGDRVDYAPAACMTISTLAKIRPDYSVPEVKSAKEWRLFKRLAESLPPFGQSTSKWSAHVLREADMTSSRELFTSAPVSGSRPLLEGRMVRQYSASAKAFVSGTGRAAVWRILSSPREPLQPQFWIRPQDLSDQVQARVRIARVGFCDITGQTNERTLLAAHIPANVVCGNKVPTIVFAGRHEFASDCWIGIANSFVVDWLVRRLATTTINLFILRSLPFPQYLPDSLPLRRLRVKVQECVARYAEQDHWGASLIRAEIECLVARMYGCTYPDMELILSEFPLLDRGQPPIGDEPRSTITRDSVLQLASMTLAGGDEHHSRTLRERVSAAREIGATPFIPSEVALRAWPVTSEVCGSQGAMAGNR